MTKPPKEEIEPTTDDLDPDPFDERTEQGGSGVNSSRDYASDLALDSSGGATVAQSQAVSIVEIEVGTDAQDDEEQFEEELDTGDIPTEDRALEELIREHTDKSTSRAPGTGSIPAPRLERPPPSVLPNARKPSARTLPPDERSSGETAPPDAVPAPKPRVERDTLDPRVAPREQSGRRLRSMIPHGEAEPAPPEPRGGAAARRSVSAALRPNPPPPLQSVPADAGDTGAAPVDLMAVSPTKILFGCVFCSSSGALEFTRGEAMSRFVFSEGKIVDAHATGRNASLADYLSARGVSPAVIDEGLGSALRRRVSHLVAFAELGKVSPGQLIEVARAWVRDRLAEVIAWRQGSCIFRSREPSEAVINLELHPLRCITEAVRTGMTIEAMDDHLGPTLNRSLIAGPDLAKVLPELGLELAELDALRRAGRSRTLSALLSASPFGSPEYQSAIRSIYLTTEAELVSFGEKESLPQRRGSTIARNLEQSVESLQAKAPLERLGLSAGASHEQIRARFKQVMAEHDPARLPPNAPIAVHRALAKLYIDAYRSLGVPDEKDDAANDAMRPAEQFIEEADKLAANRNYADALSKIREAIDHHPTLDRLPMYAAYFEFMAEPFNRQGRAQASVTALTTLLEQSPREAVGYLFLGRIHKFGKKKPESEAAFRKVLELDPSHHEAQTEVRVAENRNSMDKKSRGGSNVSDRAASALAFFKKKVQETGVGPKPEKKAPDRSKKK